MKKWIILGLLVFLLIIGGVSVYLYQITLSPMDEAKELATEIAKKETKLQTFDQFSQYNGNENYYIFEGKNNFDNDIYVWINAETKKVFVKQARHGISKEEALAIIFPNSIPDGAKVQLGMENSIAFWEISFISESKKLNYYYVDFTSGELLKKIENL